MFQFFAATRPVCWWALMEKDFKMKKAALILATVATLAAVAAAPAEARGLGLHHRGGGLATAAAVAVAAGVSAAKPPFISAAVMPPSCVIGM